MCARAVKMNLHACARVNAKLWTDVAMKKSNG